MLEDEILEEIKKNEESANENEIVEIDENEEINNTQYDLNEVKEEVKKKKKEKKPSKWSKLSKKKKILIISAIVLLLLVVVGLLLYFFVFKKDNDENVIKEPIVIVEKDNYRYEDGKLIFIDEDKKDLGEYECTNKDENLCYVAYYSNEDDFDIDQRVYENGTKIDNRSDIINNNFVFIYDNAKKSDGNIVLYNISEKEKVNTYALVKEISSDKVIVKDEKEKYNVLVFDKEDYEELVKTSYDYIGYIANSDALVVASNKNYQLLDLDGEVKSKTVPGEIKNFDSNSISVEIDKKYYIYDYDGTRKVETGYDYIRFVGTYAIVASGKKLYVYDKEGSPMTMDAIRISSSSYNTKLIFNDDLRQTGKEVAFDVTITNGNMKVEYDDGEYATINLYEGMFNKTLDFISYFQGKLYIYSDADKTSLLGSYACNYANSVDAGTTALTNCFIAKESNIFKPNEEIDSGYLPIFNNRYIFITDTKSPDANDNIILWDLKNSKKLATYKAVDVGYHENLMQVNFVDTAGTIALAKNTSDSYGLINIASSSVEGVIAFKDSNGSTNVSAGYLGDYLLFKRSDDTYHLYDVKGNEITKNVSTTSEIIAYNDNYILVKNSSLNYTIYSLDGSIASDEYKYIIMEKSYYIAVDSKNGLHVYKYDGEDDLLPSDISVDGKNVEQEINYGVKGSILVISYTYNDKVNVVEVNIG